MSNDGQWLHWFCKICQAITLGLKKAVSHLYDSVKILKNIQLKADKKEVDRQIQDIEARFTTGSSQHILEGIKTSVVDIIEKTETIGERMKKMEDKIGNIIEDSDATEVQEIDMRIQDLEEKECPLSISSNVTETKERGQRKCNLILFNMDENNSEDTVTWKTHDTMWVEEVCDELKEDVEIDKMIWLAKKSETEGARPRPLKGFENCGHKNETTD